MKKRSQQRVRKAAAVICLLAVALLYVPYASAAWYTTQQLCCANGQCETHGHKHAMSQESDEKPMDCGHGMNRMPVCKMACCKTAEQIAVNPQVFILPMLPFQTQSSPAISRIERPKVQDISQYEKPQSPPPRLIAA